MQSVMCAVVDALSDRGFQDWCATVLDRVLAFALVACALVGVVMARDRWRTWRWRRKQRRRAESVYRDIGLIHGGRAYDPTPAGIETMLKMEIRQVKSVQVRTGRGRAIVSITTRWWAWMPFGVHRIVVEEKATALLRKHAPAGIKIAVVVA